MIARFNMEKNEAEELESIFYAQAFQIVKATKDTIYQFAAEPQAKEHIEVIRRYIHTLAGDAGIVGLDNMSMLCRKIEEVLILLSTDQLSINTESIVLFMDCVNSIERTLAEAQVGSDFTGNQQTFKKLESFIDHNKKSA